ncbi:hypothetical protein [Paraherbaspirillum soli]|uniref:Phage tail protein n=1 Tax=Paraherbaspirillum soli TaxID=631222 RepID=A0ABW0M6F1_9BURK
MPASVRPNLLSESSSTEQGSGSILTALEGREPQSKAVAKKKSGVWLGVALAGLLAAFGAGGWFVWSQHSEPADTSTVVEADEHKASPQLAANTPAPEGNTAPAGKLESEAAIIENDVVAHPEKSEPDLRDARTKLTESLEAGVPVPPTSLKAALEKPKASDSKQASKGVNAPLVNRAAHEPKTAVKTTANQATDSDVNILAALVSNGESVSEPPKATSKPKAQTKKKAAEPVVAQNTVPAIDIVERKPGDSTASLLQRCRQLGLIEGEFCRWRICSGRWDSDPSCKVTKGE